MKKIATLFLFCSFTARAGELRNVRETEITPLESHYSDTRLLDLDQSLYRAGEVVKVGEQICVVWNYEQSKGRWFYTLRTAKYRD